MDTAMVAAASGWFAALLTAGVTMYLGLRNAKTADLSAESSKSNAQTARMIAEDARNARWHELQAKELSDLIQALAELNAVYWTWSRNKKEAAQDERIVRAAGMRVRMMLPPDDLLTEELERVVAEMDKVDLGDKNQESKFESLNLKYRAVVWKIIEGRRSQMRFQH